MTFAAKLFFAVLPPEASTVAGGIDFAFWLITIICGISFVLVEGALIYFVIKYRRKKGEADKITPYLTHSTKIEIIWTVIPTLILFVIFYYGMITYLELKTPPSGAETLKVTGRMWAWDIEYPICERDAESGIQECYKNIGSTNPVPGKGIPARNPIVVQLGKAYLLEMTSLDVIHSFYVPAFRIKQDVVPGLKTRQWFQAIQAGTFHMFCTEYCGLNHSGMISAIKVLPEAEYKAWEETTRAKLREKIAQQKADLASGKPPSPEMMAKLGEAVYTSKCASCHKLDGTRLVGPPLNGILGKERELSDGSKLVADEAYLLESIVNPKAKVVKGYPAAMVVQVSGDEVPQVIEYLKTLK